jgi:hypothetical protein
MKLLKLIIFNVCILIPGLSTSLFAQIDANLTSTYPVFKMGSDLENATMLESSAVMADTLGDFALAEIYRVMANAILTAIEMNTPSPDLPTSAPPRHCMKEFGDGMTGCFATYANCLIDGGMPPFTCAASNRPTVPADTMCRWFRDFCMQAARERFNQCQGIH